MIGVGPKENYESLWLDNQNNRQQTAKNVALKVMQSEKFQSKLMKLIQHFDNGTVNGRSHPGSSLNSRGIKKSISSSSISNPISFSHVSHVDMQTNFGLEKSFDALHLSKIDQCLPPTPVGGGSSATHSTNGVSSDFRRSENFEASPYESVSDSTTNVVKAISTYRTSPTPATNIIPPSHSSNSISIKLHRRTSSTSTTINVASSQFSNQSIFTSNNTGMYCSSDTSRSSSPRNSLKVSILPCIPQEELRDSRSDHERNETDEHMCLSEEENPFHGKFVSIPSAPPPPKSTVAPEDRLRSFMQREEIEIASDSEDEDISFEKFRLSSNIESITSEIQSQLQKRLNADKIIMNKECRKSIMMLLKKEAQEQSFLENLISDEEAKELDCEDAHIPKSTARKNLSMLLKQKMEHIEEDVEADDEGDDDENDTKEELMDCNLSVIGSIPFGDSTSLIDITFDLDTTTAEKEEEKDEKKSVISDFFADLEIKDSTLLDCDDQNILDS